MKAYRITQELLDKKEEAGFLWGDVVKVGDTVYLMEHTLIPGLFYLTNKDRTACYFNVTNPWGVSRDIRPYLEEVTP